MANVLCVSVRLDNVLHCLLMISEHLRVFVANAG